MKEGVKENENEVLFKVLYREIEDKQATNCDVSLVVVVVRFTYSAMTK